LWTICINWLWTWILLISASWVAGITGASHRCPTRVVRFDYIRPVCYSFLLSLPPFPSPPTSLVVPLLLSWLCFPHPVSTNERKCDTCLCGTGLFHLQWWSPVQSIYCVFIAHFP
jgi:hypothetical protein